MKPIDASSNNQQVLEVNLRIMWEFWSYLWPGRFNRSTGCCETAMKQDYSHIQPVRPYTDYAISGRCVRCPKQLAGRYGRNAVGCM
jgi:hypothetical protein